MSNTQDQSDQLLLSAWRQVQRQYPEANFLQSPIWGHVNNDMNYRTFYYLTAAEREAEAWQKMQTELAQNTAPINTAKTEIELRTDPKLGPSWCLMIVKDAKRGRYLEVPGGPLIDWQDQEAVQKSFDFIKQTAKEQKCVFVRLRPQLRADSEPVSILARQGCRPAPMHLHAEHTVMIDLTKTEEELLADMRRQTRYEVRKADKLGLTVEYGNSEELFREFHQVQVQTAERQHFVPPSDRMLMAERKAFGDRARIYVVRTAEGAPVSYGLVLIDGREAEYFEAASTELGRQVPGAYALLWRAMRDLKALGVERFNLWGIAPEGQPHHRYAGVTTFKKGFGGEVVEFVPAQDIVISRWRYLINLTVEKIRKKRRHL